MVKASTIRAFYLENRVFDQSIVGIFPKDESKIFYILALMNSDIVNELIHVINPTANNSANYIKQIPYVEPSRKTLHEISRKVEQIISFIKEERVSESEQLHSEINLIIKNIYEDML